MSLLDLQPAAGAKQTLSDEQQTQLERDLKVWLPHGIEGLAIDARRKGVAARLTPERPFGISPATLRTRRSILRWRQFPMGGWVYHDVPYRWQRQDQGQDVEIPLGRHIIAPGWGHCIAHLSDSAFPFGFGSPYAVVYIGSGRFHDAPINRGTSPFWYLGHDNVVQIRVGESFHTGRILAQTDHFLNPGWGWSEIGHAPGGGPGSMSEGPRWHYLFSPIWRWSA